MLTCSCSPQVPYVPPDTAQLGEIPLNGHDDIPYISVVDLNTFKIYACARRDRPKQRTDAADAWVLLNDVATPEAPLTLTADQRGAVKFGIEAVLEVRPSDTRDWWTVRLNL